MNKKSVSFNLGNNRIITTYSPDEYQRHQIDSILYRRNYRRVSDEEWNRVHVLLDLYKIYEMIIHPDSVQNNMYNRRITFGN